MELLKLASYIISEHHHNRRKESWQYEGVGCDGNKHHSSFSSFVMCWFACWAATIEPKHMEATTIATKATSRSTDAPRFSFLSSYACWCPVLKCNGTKPIRRCPDTLLLCSFSNRKKPHKVRRNNSNIIVNAFK